MIQKVRMKRHESFSIREGWLAKGLNEVKKNNKVLMKVKNQTKRK